MSINFESILKANLDNYMDDVYVGIPARIVGVQQIEDGLVDVQPLINNIFADGSKIEFPTIYSIPIIMPSTMTSSITMPVNHGDSVFLMFSQRDIDVFKNGADTPHDASSFRKFNMNDGVALIGLSTINKSKLSKKNHSIPFDNESLILAHNIGTDRESYIKFNSSGAIDIEARSNLNVISPDIKINATNINVECEQVNLNASMVDIKSTVLIDGMNLNNFMKVHYHPYTDDGRPMNTAPPTGF